MRAAIARYLRRVAPLVCSASERAAFRSLVSAQVLARSRSSSAWWGSVCSSHACALVTHATPQLDR